MDKIILNEGVSFSHSDSNEPWTEFLEKNPSIDGIFKSGLASPLFLDLLFADQEFTPFHDNPDKNGAKYRIRRECIEKAVKEQAFNGRPIYLKDRHSPDHAFKDRRAIGTIHGAIMREDERGLHPQVIASIWAKDIPAEFTDIQENQDEVGASAEFFIKSAVPAMDVTDITDLLPSGAILMDKDNAAFKNTAIYCSDPTLGGEPGDGQNKDTKTDCDPKTKKGGNKLSKFCETCSPLVEQHIDAAVNKAMEKLVTDLKAIGDNSKVIDDLKLAAADATKEKEAIQKKFDDFKVEKEAKEKADLGNLHQLIAAGDANTEFEKRKGDYEEDKHKEVHRILFKIRMSQATPEEVLQLADWKKASSDKGGSDQLGVPGGGSDDGDKKMPDKEIDNILALAGIPGVPVQKEGS